MFSWFKKAPARLHYPSLDTQAKVAAWVRRGELVVLQLVPEEFGGERNAANSVFVPRWVVDRKRGIDLELVSSLSKTRKFSHYSTQVFYTGSSLVPSTINIYVYGPGYYSVDINVW